MEILFLFIHILTIIIVHGNISIIHREINGIILSSTPISDYIIYSLTAIWTILLLTRCLNYCYNYIFTL